MLELLTSCIFFGTTGATVAKNPHHKNGHSLLGGKLKQNGRHQIDKAGQATVSADVNNGKVTAMSANHPQKGNLPARKVKSNRKLAHMESARVHVAANTSNDLRANTSNDLRFAQAAVYYAWCFDDGLDEYCYWYPAEVIVDSGSVEYVD
jgi:hypothetical protein